MPRTRSLDEIAFRIKQELANLWLYWRRPAVRLEPPSPLPGLPDPLATVHRLRNTRFASDVIRIADGVLQRQLPAMDREIAAGNPIRWRWDYAHASGPSPLRYFRLIPYMDYDAVGDYRFIWEFNRHQHLVAVAQAFLFTEERKYADEVIAQLESWWEQNPFLEGINWTSALEVAFRALSWIWIYHLMGSAMSARFRTQFITELYRHARFLEYNLSFYFSPNTHLQGEAVALHAIGALFPALPHARRWRALGGETVIRQMQAQVYDDGAHFEHSTYYHVYALDFFLLHSLLNETPDAYRNKLVRMAEYLAALSGPAGTIPLIGDDDGGRVFHPFGPRDRFGAATLASCGVLFDRPEWVRGEEELAEQAAWWLGAQSLDFPRRGGAAARSQVFRDCGVAVLSSEALHVVMDNGPFGVGSGGHSHCDTLAITVRMHDENILADSGTYTYVLTPWRDRFRSSAAHNTVRIDGRDQALSSKAFGWRDRPEAEILATQFDADRDFIGAECRYGGFTHHRRVLFLKPWTLIVLDEIDGPPGEHVVEQFWHPAAALVAEEPAVRFRIGSACLILEEGATADVSEGGEYGWISKCLGHRRVAPVICRSVRAPFPALLAAVIDGEAVQSPVLRLRHSSDSATCIYQTAERSIEARFPVGRLRRSSETAVDGVLESVRVTPLDRSGKLHPGIDERELTPPKTEPRR